MELTTPIDMLRSLVAGNAYRILRDHAKPQDLGLVFPAGLFYALWKATPDVRIAHTPDASFVSRTRLPERYDITLPYPGAPDLAVEVVTITETGIASIEKVRDYLKAGTEQVWVLYTSLKEVHIYRRDEPKIVRVYQGDDVIEVGSPLPGLRFTAAELFELP